MDEEKERQDIIDDLEHETVNLYAEEGIFLPYPEATWWTNDEPAFDIYVKAAALFQEMLNRLAVSPTTIGRSEKRIFEARYEFPQYQRLFKHEEAIISNDVIGFIDFMGGVPYGCMEKLGIMGEVFSGDAQLGTGGGGKAVAPLPETFFSEDDGLVLLFNKIWLGYDNVDPFAKGLGNYPKPCHDWWLRLNLVEHEASSNTVPTPGEFLGITIHIFPNLPWGWQETSPFIFSGNWVETVYYTGGRIASKVNHTTYVVKYQGQEIEARTSDYAQYEVDDWVAVLKGVDHPEDSMTWEDLQDFAVDQWWIVPMAFYKTS